MILDEIASLLQAQGVGIQEESIFVARSTDEEISHVTVIEIPGSANARTQSDPLGTEHPRVQVFAKADRYVDSRVLAEKAYRALAAVNNQQITDPEGGEGAFYLRVIPNTPPHFMGRDHNEMVIIGFNCDVQKRPSPLP